MLPLIHLGDFPLSIWVYFQSVSGWSRRPRHRHVKCESEKMPEFSCCLLELMLWNGKVDVERLGRLHLSSVSMKMSSSASLVHDHQGLCWLFYAPVHWKKALLFGEIQALKNHPFLIYISLRYLSLAVRLCQCSVHSMAGLLVLLLTADCASWSRGSAQGCSAEAERPLISVSRVSAFI